MHICLPTHRKQHKIIMTSPYLIMIISIFKCLNTFLVYKKKGNNDDPMIVKPMCLNDF